MQEFEALIIQARSCDVETAQRHEAFAELVNRFQDSAYHWACAVLGDVHLAQDAVQEAFVTAYQNLEQLREPKAFPGWFRQIVLSHCHRLVRGKQLPVNPIDASLEVPSVDPGPAATVEVLELKDKVMAAVHTLPESERVVTKLFYLNGYSQSEIARLLELPVTTVKKRLQYARQHLRAVMVSMFDTLYPPQKPRPIPVPIPVTRRPPDGRNY